MTPKHIQDAAEAAYNIFRAKYPNEPAWADYPPKHKWHDMVTAQLAHPDAAPANEAEAAVKQAIDELANPVRTTDPLPKLETVAERPKKSSPKK